MKRPFLCCVVLLILAMAVGYSKETPGSQEPNKLIQQPKNQAIQMIHSLMSRIRYIFMHGHMRTT